MKSLDQVEPRTAITNVPYFISQPGSYYFTTNLTGTAGITISVGGVTLDLMGFELVGGTGDGIFVSTLVTNVSVRNGTVRGWNTGTAVQVGNARNCRLEQLAVSGNTDGVNAGPGSVVQDCIVTSNGGSGMTVGDGSAVKNCVALLNWYGISAGRDCTIIGCTVSTNLTDGIITGTGCTVQNSVANRNAGRGINTGNGATVLGCSARNNALDGIDVGNDSSVVDCVASLNTLNGISVLNYSGVRNNICSENGAAGVLVSSQRNRVEGNHVAQNKRGIEVTTSSANLIIKNSAYNNPPTGATSSSNYVFIGATFGPTNNLVGVGGVITNENPWANFSL
jgi:parallel beta-helix repeat protein